MFKNIDFGKIIAVIVCILIFSYIIYSAYLQTRVHDNEIICKECGEWFKEYGHYNSGLILSIPRGTCSTCKKLKNNAHEPKPTIETTMGDTRPSRIPGMDGHLK